MVEYWCTGILRTGGRGSCVVEYWCIGILRTGGRGSCV